MSILEKIQKFLKNDKKSEVLQNKESEITFLSDTGNSYTLYFQNSDNKYIFVGDVNYSYSQSDLDVDWIDMNKHNFEIYEVYNDLSELLERNKEVEKTLEAKSIEYIDDDYGYEEEPVETLPKGWKWGIYGDNSGSLISPTGKDYFSFDWNTREYQLTLDSDYERVMEYDLLGREQTFKTFKRYAEKYTKEHLVSLKENQLETIQSKIEKAKEKSKEQISNSRGREPLKIERNGTTL